MKQEHRFVAQLFGYLAPFVDEEQALFLSLDGEAAKRGVTEKHFTDSIVPDIWLTLLDGRALRIEAKIMSWARGFSVGHSQHEAWFGASGGGSHKPTGWVVANEALKEFFYWPHAKIAHQPTKVINQGRYFTVEAPSMKPKFGSLQQLALHLLAKT
jgi:hypothetical protein